MLGLVQTHAVNVYEVLKCIGSVSFISKLPQSNGPLCLENELSFLVACDLLQWTGAHNSFLSPPLWGGSLCGFASSNTSKRFKKGLYLILLDCYFTRGPKSYGFITLTPSCDLLIWPGYFFKLIFGQQNVFFLHIKKASALAFSYASDSVFLASSWTII